MQNSFIKNITKAQIRVQAENNLTRDDLLEVFYNGIKPVGNLKIGMEYERLPVEMDTFKSVGYFGENGLQHFLLKFGERYAWDEVRDNAFIIGLRKNNVQISLEPGSQIEISTAPHSSIMNIEKEISIVEKQMNLLAFEMGIKFLSYGVSPYNTWQSIPLIPKTRYHIMAKMLPGDMAPVMMRETAGIQVTFDFHSEEDAIKKMSTALMLSPFATSIFANSPVHAGENTGYQSYRASAWLDTDSNRCGLVSYKLFEAGRKNFTFEDYLDVVLNVPMLYFVRGEEYIKVNTYLTFKSFMAQGFQGYYATKEDFELHLNLYFPEVRLRNYLEIRNHDSVPGIMKYAVPALYKGILYDEDMCDAILEMFEDFSYTDFIYLRENVPQHGLRTKIGKYQVLDYAKEILAAAQDSLCSANDNDSKYLNKCISLIQQKKSLADLTLENHDRYSF